MSKNFKSDPSEGVATVTLAQMAVISESQPIQLPNEFITALKPEGARQVIIILAPNTKIIRIIPTSSDSVAKIVINIEKLSPDFLRQMGSIFIRLGIKTLYSTGLCFTSDACVYEGYIDSSELQEVAEDRIYNEFKSIPGVSTVSIELLAV